MSEHVLDRLIWNALTGDQAGFAIGSGKARRYRLDIGPLAATQDRSPESQADLAALVHEHGPAFIVERADHAPAAMEPAGTRIIKRREGIQLVFAGDRPALDDTAMVKLTRDHYPQMLELARLTEPGPFADSTADLGQFWGLIEGGLLVAMAGQRMRVPGFVEVSGVCALPQVRGRGLASRLMRKVIADILEEGRVPFLHSYADNESALALYGHLGFAERARVWMTLYDAAP
ncbi:GNAT family N-acetyltransferase [Novosphingobium pentaromativorans]|uniref:GCN5-related N-acetyltransferase n=1 Tax=Novosphingobium pentaromativorans US6-1 TaxID=1088721 RepID=G6E8Y3_9SPHN|nr:GNAT family N-acetyltransferase [Novosphingobium pentaromativorans]AIT81190.1 GCN5 family acetyltransferase [Novosphingobium pentaromativorans US6-1]EHJ62207.1 GCN5-related N-acetyltransferase [Novosphingobium pentaromativorans US6-1]